MVQLATLEPQKAWMDRGVCLFSECCSWRGTIRWVVDCLLEKHELISHVWQVYDLDVKRIGFARA